MIQMNEPTIEDKVLGTTYHSKKVISFLIDDENKELDVTIYFDETPGESEGRSKNRLVCIRVGENYTWSNGDEHDRDLAISEAITDEIEKILSDYDVSEWRIIGDKIEERVKDELFEAGFD